MKKIKQFWRIIYIIHVLAKNGLDKLILNLRIFSPLRFIIYLNPFNWLPRKHLPRGEAITQTLTTLGPIFVKFGQALSTRPDLIPDDIIKELSKLQDRVTPFASNIALSQIKEAFGREAHEVFSCFDKEVLASASIAQVHAAKLNSGEDVVVKILRPNMLKIIEKDIGILKTLARLAESYWPKSARFKPRQVVRDFEQTLLDELDLQREAANASQLRRNFQNSDLLYVPEIHWEYTHKNILVMERIYGIPVTNIESLNKHNINLQKLAANGVEIFFIQVFRDCFFHADMHPGNIFVSPRNPDHPQYLCVDFGIMGTINDNDKRYLAENFIAFFNRDYRRVARLHVESGWVTQDTRTDEFESAIRTVCEPIFEKPLKDISLAALVLRLFQVARRFNMEVQPQLVLLQKTLVSIEGLGKQIFPELDLWDTAKPYLEKWAKEQITPKKFLNQVKDNIPFMIEQLPHMPRLMYDVLEQTKMQHSKLNHLQHFHKKNNRSSRRGFGLGLIFATILFIPINCGLWTTKTQTVSIIIITATVGVLLALTSSKKEL